MTSTDKLGEKHSSFRFCFVSKTLKLSGFPNDAVHGWIVKPIHNPPVVSVNTKAFI